MADSEVADVKTVTAVELLELQKTPGVMVIDVRLPIDYFGGRIKGSLNLPGTSIQGRVGKLPAEARFVFVCDDGRQGSKIASLAQSLGFNDVSVLRGGYDAWLEAGLPTETITEGVFPAMPGPPSAASGAPTKTEG